MVSNIASELAVGWQKYTLECGMKNTRQPLKLAKHPFTYIMDKVN